MAKFGTWMIFSAVTHKKLLSGSRQSTVTCIYMHLSLVIRQIVPEISTQSLQLKGVEAVGDERKGSLVCT